MSNGKKKKVKIATYKSVTHSYDGWKAFINELGLYDPKYEKVLTQFTLVGEIRHDGVWADKSFP